MRIPAGLSLTKEEQKLWREVCKHCDSVLQNSDVYAIEQFVRSLCRWRRLHIIEAAAVASGSDTYKVGTMIATATKAMDTAMARLALSPADRKKLMSSGTPGKVAKLNPLTAALGSRN